MREVVSCQCCGGVRADPVLELNGWRYVACAGCGLRYISPAPTSAELAKYYSGLVYAGGHPVGDKADVECVEAARNSYAVVLCMLEKKLGAPGRLLEVGCSGGYFLVLAREAGWVVAGVDISTSAIERARRVLGPAVRQGGLREAGFEAESFDAVVMLAVIEHLEFPGDELAESRRILRPGGMLLVTTGEVESVEERLWRRFRRGKPDVPCWYAPPEHLFCFSRRTLAGLLERTGFTGVTMWSDFDSSIGVGRFRFQCGPKGLVRVANMLKVCAKIGLSYAAPGRFRRNEYIMTAIAEKRA